MSFILQLSTVPAERLRDIVREDRFPWDDPDAARSVVESACAGSPGDPDREAELLMLALRSKVPVAVQRTFDSNPGAGGRKRLTSVADYYSQRPEIADKIDLREARWSVDTIAAMMDLLPVEAVGTIAQAPGKPERQYQPEEAAVMSDATAYAPPAQNNPPPAWNPAPTPLPPPPGSGVALGGALAPNQAWPPPPNGGSLYPPLQVPTVPEEVENNKWSWAGFLAGGLWMLAHRLWAVFGVAFLAGAVSRAVPGVAGTVIQLVVTLGISVYLGLNGNRLAWNHRNFNSVDQFRSVQRAWTVYGVIVTALVALLIIAVIVRTVDAARTGYRNPGQFIPSAHR